MTWEAVYGGVVEIEQSLPEVVGMIATPTYCDIYFKEVSDTAPVAQMFTLYINSVETDKSGFCYDGSSTVRIYYPEIEAGHNTPVTFAISNYSGLDVPAGTFTAVIA